MLTPRRTKSFVFAPQTSFSTFSLRDLEAVGSFFFPLVIDHFNRNWLEQWSIYLLGYYNQVNQNNNEHFGSVLVLGPTVSSSTDFDHVTVCAVCGINKVLSCLWTWSEWPSRSLLNNTFNRVQYRLQTFRLSNQLKRHPTNRKRSRRVSNYCSRNLSNH